MIPPSWISATTQKTSQNQQIQFTRARGPGTSLSPSSVVRPVVIVYRPNSICTNTLIRQPRMMSHMRVKPASAPTAVVAISSPDPTMDPAMIRPGPSWRRMSRILVGGARIPSCSFILAMLLLVADLRQPSSRLRNILAWSNSIHDEISTAIRSPCSHSCHGLVPNSRRSHVA